jgi:MYXO-CTERM domain-containing protein
LRRLLAVAFAAALVSSSCSSRSDADAAVAASGRMAGTGRSRVPPVRPDADGRGPACTEGAGGTSCAAGGPSPFVPGRLVVKFREGLSEPADVVHASGLRFADVVPSGGADLDRLTAEHRVRSVTPLFSSFSPAGSSRPGRGARAERRRSLLDAVARARAAHPGRARRAAPEAVVPDLTSVYVLEVPPDVDVRRMARAFAANPAVEYASPDHLAEATALPDDPYLGSSGAWGQPFGDLWALHRIGAPAAWASAGSRAGEGVVVAVVDTGLDREHPDIAANAWVNEAEASGTAGLGIDDDHNGFVDDVRGWDFAYGDTDPRDGHGHGTHVAGTIAAAGDNALGVVGVAYRARVMAVKGLDDAGNGSFTALAKAIVYAARSGADVINNSWSCTGPGCSDAAVKDAIALARSLGCVVVFAAGNDGGDVRETFPANVPEVLTVSATAVGDAPASFTNWGWLVDVAAPGGGPGAAWPYEAHRNILSLRAAGTGDPGLAVGMSYLRQAGTSMAAPHVSGVAALLLAENRSLTAPEVESIIRHSARDLVGDPAIDGPGYDLDYGWGLLDAAAAVSLASAPPPDPPVLRVVGGPLSFVTPTAACSGRWSLPLDLYNLGGGALGWSASAPAWLTVTPSSGAAGASLAASVATAESRTGTLVLDAPDAVDGFVELPVSQELVGDLRIRNCDAVLGQTSGSQRWDPPHNQFTAPPGVADGAGGAIHVWVDTRNGNPDLFVQRHDPLGRPAWYAPPGLPGLHGEALTSAAGAESRPALIADGAGGAIVAYAEGPNSSDLAQSHIRVQRIDAAANKLWGASGVWLVQATGGQMRPVLAPDGAGGAIVAWNDFRNGGVSDVYAQRVRADGTLAWTPDGVQVASADGAQFDPAIAQDGAGGAFVVWTDARTGYFAIHAQHLDATGARLWGIGGTQISPASDDGPNVTSDGAGGAIIAWNDYRNLPRDPSGVTLLDRCEIYAARVDGIGNALWAEGGVPVMEGVTASPNKFLPGWQPSQVTMAPDGRGGLFFAWHDARSEVDWDVYAQRLDLEGNRLWGPSGAPVTTAPDHQISPAVLSDGRDGALFAWTDLRPGSGDVLVQRLGPTGAPLMPPGGAWVQSKPGDQMYPHVVALARRRFLVSWDDENNCGGLVGCGLFTGVDMVGRVLEFNDAPVATPRSVAAIEDRPSGFILAGSDPDHDSLTYSVVSGPSNGTLSGTAPGLRYTPAADYAGEDSFTFKVNDGTVDSPAATVSITVAGVNDAPVASALSVAATEDTPVGVTLSGSDVDGDSLTYAIAIGPAHGTLSGTPPALGYAPAADWSGTDNFTFRVNDGTSESAPATVTVAVAAVNDAPAAEAWSVETQEGTAIAVTLSAADVDGDPLTYRVVSGPAHGTLSGAAPALTYTPAAGYSGEDAFAFVANDGVADSAPATVSVTVSDTVDPPPAADPPGGGCGCTTGADAAPLAFILAALAVRRRRRS